MNVSLRLRICARELGNTDIGTFFLPFNYDMKFNIRIRILLWSLREITSLRKSNILGKVISN